MKAENGCGELRRGYCSFPRRRRGKGAPQISREESMYTACKIVLMMPFCVCGSANEDALSGRSI